jgi:hypothetical protein
MESASERFRAGVDACAAQSSWPQMPTKNELTKLRRSKHIGERIQN